MEIKDDKSEESVFGIVLRVEDDIDAAVRHGHDKTVKIIVLQRRRGKCWSCCGLFVVVVVVVYGAK